MTASHDPSSRFVLPESATLLANLAALWAVDPALAGELEACLDSDGYPVETSQAGLPTVALPTADGRRIYLHSRYQPLDEAKRLLDACPLEAKAVFCVHGLGLGYHLEALAQRVGPEALLLVLEPDLKLIRTAFEHRDLSKLIETGRLIFIHKLDRGELIAKLSAHQALVSAGFGFVPHAPSLQVQAEFHRQMQAWMSEFVAYCRTSLNTLVLNGRRTCENIARNLKWYLSKPGINHLKDKHRGRPAIIVSAGPSLRKNKHLLQDAQGKAVLIAVQTTLQVLLEMGLPPDYVTSLDYHEISTRFYEKLPRDLQTELVAEPKASSAIFKLYPGPMSLLGNDFADRLLKELKLQKDHLQSGATVAHLAFYLAEYMGCDPIIFVGQDLGFGDGLCYTPGTSYEDVWRPELNRFCTVEMKQWEQIVRDRPILRKVCDWEGRPMYTEERLFAYLQQFERDFAASSRQIIDATEGGAAKRGAKPMTLQEAIKTFCTTPPLPPSPHLPLSHSPLPPFPPSSSPPESMSQCLKQPASVGCASAHALPSVGCASAHALPSQQPTLSPDSMIQCLKQRRDEAEQIEQIARQTLPLLEEVRDCLADQDRVNRLIAQIDVLRARMMELNDCYELVTQLTQHTEMLRFQSDRQIAAARLTGIERQKRQVQRDILNVRGIVEAAGQFQKLIDELIG